MHKVIAVIRREFIETTRTKAFIFATLFTPIFLAVMMVVPGLLASRSSETQTRLAVLDQTGRAFAALNAELGSDPNRYVFQKGKLQGQPRFTLADAGTSGTVGPNLDESKPSRESVHQQVENGGGGMPAFEGRLSQAEIDAISSYVASAAGSGGGGESGDGGPGSSP